MKVTDFEGGWLYGPKTFAEVTGRKKLWSKAPQQLEVMEGTRPCPLCGQNEPVVLFTKGQWDYSRCSVCRMVYTANAPTPESLDAYYRDGGAPRDWVDFTQQHNVELDLDRRKFRWALRLAGWGPRLALLDIGCSTGTLLEVADEMASGNCTLAAVEPNDDALEIARKRVDLTFAENRLDVMANGDMDFVVLWEVLEHVLEPRKLLEAAVEDMNEAGATLLVCVPNMSSLAARMLHEKAPMFGTGHLQMYNPRTLRQAILSVLPEANVKMYSIISWTKEIANWLTFREPFASDDPRLDQFFEMNPEWVCENLYGYKLVAVATTGEA